MSTDALNEVTTLVCDVEGNRTAVLMRKACCGNQSEVGAETQAILMLIFRTLKRRGHDP